MPYFDDWLEIHHPANSSLWTLTERDNARNTVLDRVCDSVADHLIGEDILARLRLPLAAEAVRNRLPTKKRIRSGDLAEIIATDFVREKSEFTVPLLRLRYKDDRDMSMRGDDLIAIDRALDPPAVLKAEVKSRATIGPPVISEACTALNANGGRPKPSSLAFVSMMLRREGRDDMAEIVERLQEADLSASRITHLVFVLSGNNPARALEPHVTQAVTVRERRFVALRIADHQQFVELAFRSSMPETAEQLLDRLRKLTLPGIRGRLFARGLARGMIWRNGVVPAEGPEFAATLTNDLLDHAYGILGLALRASDYGASSDTVASLTRHSR